MYRRTLVSHCIKSLSKGFQHGVSTVLEMCPYNVQLAHFRNHEYCLAKFIDTVSFMAMRMKL
jgi:hypothetical protein